ncbi:hypothetical protein JVU11DRAFT_8148 [Chiua virens]|nr:hypothetical protein JVU11DRAFT_8148 [Chiua virens]
MVASVPVLLDKLARFRPRFVCFVGMVIWEVVRNGLVKLQKGMVKRVDNRKKRHKSQMGLQIHKLVYGEAKGNPACHRFVITLMRYIEDLPQETFLYVVPCTSGRVVQYQVCPFTNYSSLYHEHFRTAFRQDHTIHRIARTHENALI